MKRSFFLVCVCFACNSSAPRSSVQPDAAANAWRARLHASACRRPTMVTAAWPEFLTARRRATIRVPLFLRPDRFQAAAENERARKTGLYPTLASGWNTLETGGAFAQLGVGVDDSVKLVYGGPPEPEESICIENVGGAQATILSSNRGARVGGAQNGTASDDSAAPLGPYIVFATMRFPDGPSLRILGTATTPDQQNQMLAAIRTIRRIP